MGKLNVVLLRYLSREHFRVLTAVRITWRSVPGNHKRGLDQGLVPGGQKQVEAGSGWRSGKSWLPRVSLQTSCALLKARKLTLTFNMGEFVHQATKIRKCYVNNKKYDD